MPLTLSIIIGVFQVIFQIAAFYFAYNIYNYDRLNRSWLAITLALAIMTWWRVAALALEVLQVTPPSNLELVERTFLPLLVSLLFLMGMVSLNSKFESFDLMQKETDLHIKVFQSQKAGKKK